MGAAFYLMVVAFLFAGAAAYLGYGSAKGSGSVLPA